MLLTKIHIPKSGNNIVHRSDLNQKLNIGLSRKLILISAPPGFGKTTALSDWIHQNNISTAWVSLHNCDNDPVKFLSYIIFAIQSIHKEFGVSALKLLNSPNKPLGESVINLLLNEMLTIDVDFLLTLDDFHIINNPEILELTEYFIEHIPSHIHIAILTRSDPGLPYARLRSQRQLLELRSSDLSFSANDIAILFNKKLNMGLSADEIKSLEHKTEGWIAGLQLTAISMQGREDISEFIRFFKGDNRYIMDYLIEEVLKAQTDEIKEFLLQSSILEQMSAHLCNSIFNRKDSHLILEQLDKNNMFIVPLDDERKWYRYHHLFGDLLKQKLQQENPEAFYHAHYKACEWFERINMIDFAIAHALVVQNYDKAIQLIGNNIEKMWENGQHAAILKYGDTLPYDLIIKNAEFCLYYAWILIISGQIQKSTTLLASAESITQSIINKIDSSDEEISYNKKLLGKISVAFALLYSITSNAKSTLCHCKLAMECLSDEDPLWYSWGWNSIGIAESLSEHFEESIVAYEKALNYGKQSGNIYIISTIAINSAYHEVRMGHYSSAYKKCSDLIMFMKESGYSQITKSESTYATLYSCLAGIECMRLDFDEAYENIKIAYNLSKNDSNNSYKVLVILVYLLVLFGRRDYNGGIILVNEIDDIVKKNKIAPAVMSIYINWKGRMFIDLNEPDKAKQLFQTHGIELNKTIPHLYDRAYLSFSMFLITNSRFADAESILCQLESMARAVNRLEALIEVKIGYAILFKQTGKKDLAIACLVEALEYAAQDNILMAFIVNYSMIKELMLVIYRMQETSKTTIPKQLTDKLKNTIEKMEKTNKSNCETGLSFRELDTLKLIAQDLSNREIADKLFISLNTVKTHVSNILIKLDVEKRTQAVNKAKELGIL